VAAHCLVAACIIVAISGCGDRNARPQDSAGGGDGASAALASNGTFAQDSLRDWLIEWGLVAVPQSETEIIGTMGTPDSILRLPVPNQQDPIALDTIIETHYPGWSASLRKVDGAAMLQAIHVMSDSYLAGPIRMGTDTFALRRLLGPPMLGGERPGYTCGSCGADGEAVRFDLADGKVTGIWFEFSGH
jgi:hypothetical protein